MKLYNITYMAKSEIFALFLELTLLKMLYITKSEIIVLFLELTSFVYIVHNQLHMNISTNLPQMSHK